MVGRQEELGLSEELHKLSSGLSSPLLSLEEKKKYLNEINDAYVKSDCNLAGGRNYVSLKSAKNDASLFKLPNLECSHFRKGYTIMAWIRPNEGIDNLDDSNNNAILYRLSHGDKFGVITTLKQLKHDKQAKTLSCNIQVQTFSSKIQSTTSSSTNSFPTYSLPVTFSLLTNEFSLLTISHTHPYLKNPQIFVTVNHKILVKTDLSYPFSSQNLSSKSNLPENNLLLTNNIVFKNMPISCSMLSILKEPLFKDESDNIFSNLLSDAGPSASILLCKAGILVPPVPPQKDANVESFSNINPNTISATSSHSSHSSSNFSRRNQASSNFHRHSLGSSISVHPKSVDLQNYLSRSLIVLYDFESVHTLTQEAKIFSPPCVIRNIGSVENVHWITSPTLQRSNSGERRRLGKGVSGVGLASNNVTSFSVYISGSNSKHILNPLHTSSNTNKNASISMSSYSSRTYQPYSSKSTSTLLYTSDLLLSFLLPYHLALFPQEEQRHFVQDKHDKSKAPTPLQPKLQAQREGHLKDLLADQGQFAMDLLLGIANLLEISWFCREEALQSGIIYSIAIYSSKLLESTEDNESFSTHHKEQIVDNLEKGLLRILEVCCGKAYDENSLRRTSDLALACVLGLGLNFRLLAYFSTSSLSESNDGTMGERKNLILEQIAFGYQSFGDVLRQYYSPQTLLDQMQIYFPSMKQNTSETISNQFELLLKVLLQSSLSSPTYILRSEEDIQACVQALTNTNLGSLISRMILRAFNSLKSRRLARNLWIGEYPKVIAPVLLSRSVFGGDDASNAINNSSNEGKQTTDGWREEWRSAFELYLWLTSIQGTESQNLYKSFGNLFLESAKAGSLDKCVNDKFAQHLFEMGNQATKLSLSPEERRLEEIFLSDTRANRVRALLPLLPGLVTSLVAQNHQQQSKTPKHHIVPVLNTILGGVALSLKQLTESTALTHESSNKISFFFTNRQTQLDSDMIGHKKTLEWIPILISVVDLLQNYEVENHTDWLDVEQSNQDVQAKEFQITSCIDLVLDSICTLVISSMRIGGKTTVATLQKIKSCAQLTKIIHMTLNRCSHIGSRTFSAAMCAGVARLCVFLEEHQNLEWDERLNWTLIEMLQRGRQVSGWYQISNTTIPHPKSEVQSETHLDESRGIRKKLTQFVDENLIQTSSEIYHTLRDDQVSDSSFEYMAILYLPILQPTLRIILRNVPKISSTKEFNSKKTLLQHVIEEIELSVTAAVVGMTFSNARDIGLGCISSLRSSINVHKSKDDLTAISLLEELLIKITKELRERYEIERNSKHAAQYAAYEDSEEDGENSRLVEELIFGNDKLTEDHQDFILYPESLSTTQLDNADKSKAILGWSKYSGLGNALDLCFEVEGDANTNAILLLLKPFLDEWDAAVEMERSDMINLFDDENNDAPDSIELKQNDAAGDAAAQYIELSSAEKQRLKEVDNIFSSLVYQCEFSASNMCWEKWMENAHPDDEEFMEWERSIGERGGRDMYSRLGTCWIAPQFPKFIPDYLDQSKKSENDPISAFDGEFNLGGQVEIVDITKKNYFDDGSDNSDDHGSLGFPDLKDLGEDEDESSTQIDEQNEGTNISKKSSAYHKNNDPVSSPFSSTNVQSRTALSSFSHSPDITAPHEASLIPFSQIETYCENILHVRPEGSRKGVLLVTKTHLIIEYYYQYYESEIMAMEEAKNRKRNAGESNKEDEDEIKELTKSINTFGRPNSSRFLISEITQAYLRRYRLRDSAIELFFLSSGGSSSFSGSNSLFIDFGPGPEGNKSRDAHATHIMRSAPQNSLKQYPEKSNRFLQEQLQKVTVAWVQGCLSNFDYLMQLNILSGRSFNDLCQYPVMPWVLSNYHSPEIPNLSDPTNFRDMTKPMGALNEKRLAEFVERFETFADPNIPPFMYGSHYSTSAGVVLHFLVRLHPFAGLHRHLQGGHFDVADRLFCNVQRTWETCTGASVSEVKELTPEWYCNPAFLTNVNKFELGESQEGELIDNVILPPWAKGSPEKFVEVMRCAMESDICSAMLPDWIDLIFGYKQQGPASVKAHNVFFYLTYYGSIDLSAIKDDDLRIATELQIAHFGQCPMQLFWKPHVRKFPDTDSRRKSTMSCYLNLWSKSNLHGNPKLFENSPISHWVHLGAPPPGPHGDLICVRACIGNRIVSVDERGVLHFFRWSWKPEEDTSDDDETDGGKSSKKKMDRGCFVAQRELSNFRSLPRLPLQIHNYNNKREQREPRLAVAISHQLYLMSSHLLVLSDGDGCGGLGLQFVDPKKGIIKTETVLPFIHSSRISAIDMDSIGMPGGKYSKGPSGEVAIVGSDDGTATLWRFIFNSHIPLRPRLRMRGHSGRKIQSVAVNCFLNLCATVSKTRCCLFHLGNGTLIRSFTPPARVDSSNIFFVGTGTLCISLQGYLVLVCQSTRHKKVFYSLELYTLEGKHCGSHILESIRGLPHKVNAFADGKAVCVCTGIGVTIHRISSIHPLEKIDEWCIADQENASLMNPFTNRKVPAMCDIDFYPMKQSIGPPYNSRPCIAAAACTNGTLRIHAMAGITRWCAENHVNSVTSVVGNVFVKPANTIKSAVGNVKGFGSKVLGIGKDIKREVGGVISPGGVVSAGGAFVGGLLRGKNKRAP